MAFTQNDITITVTNGIHIIKFNNPQKRNAIITDAYDTIVKSLKESAKNSEILFTVFTGEGDYYCSGFNILNSAELVADDLETVVSQNLEKVKAFVTALIDYPKLLIAVVNGPAIGIGCTMLSLCDVVYASNKASFRTPFSNLGLCAECCSSYTFPIILGNSKANEVLLLSHKMSAEEAEKYGLVSKVYKHADLPELWKNITKFKDVSNESIIISKQMIKKFHIAKLHEANNIEIENLKKLMTSEAFFNAIMKFMSRRNESKL